MEGTKPFYAKPEHQEPLGFPGELVEDWQDKAIDKMGELLGKYRGLQVYLDSCVKCGACTDKCHYYLGTADPKNMPVARQDLLRSIYRRYFTFAGKYFPKLVGARDLTRDVVDEWYSYFHQCSQCRRCSVFCPYGIDTAEVSMAAREILDTVGVGQKYCNEIIGKVYKVGNNLGLPEPALRDTLEDLEEEIEEDTGVKVRLPLDEEGADVLLITPSADFFAEPHIDGLMGYAKVFHEAGVTWTLSSYASEAANFSMFIGSYENMKKQAERIRKAALDLKVKRIVHGECGHAWRVAYSFWNTLAGVGQGADPNDKYAQELQRQLDPNYPVPQHICEFTWDLIKQGKLNFDKSANDHRVVTYHDSCNVARASRMGDEPGGQFTIPRNIIKAVCNNYVDMPEDTIGEATFCCGGGGGLLTDDLMEVRVKGAQPRMQALHEVVESNGVTNMAAICAICKSQFTKVLPYYKMGMDMIVSVHQLVSDAIVLTGQKTGDEEEEGEEAAEA
ncbi:MAG: (Fe-S)-binding protein [Gammaproteobacteria bacterium]|nr:(Fe-S)-binding protein [Gammaproteobacteria bacterium]NIR99105.1 (Fe-S)-binding protein [Gammaproteobacteria bacterium]NIT64737.1 (Fe-S)-binding protein [Gammaproteobacteria bacterium]NIV21695.1 (Fe-S)-binding protein [Gammaproteobacteria bacterium]NIX10566.1 (Fe-S)-binding protein [Gammaproteobacteria bacterium]